MVNLKFLLWAFHVTMDVSTGDRALSTFLMEEQPGEVDTINPTALS